VEPQLLPGGIAAAVFFGYMASLVSKPKIKKQ